MKVSRRETIDRYYLLQWRGRAVFLHRIHHSDPSGIYHDHPWPWFSIIFGSYVEERPGVPSRIRQGLNWIQAGVPHRVTLTRGPVWTLLFHGQRRCSWSVYDNQGRVIEQEPWRGTENPTRRSYRTAAV